MIYVNLEFIYSDILHRLEDYIYKVISILKNNMTNIDKIRTYEVIDK